MYIQNSCLHRRSYIFCHFYNYYVTNAKINQLTDYGKPFLLLFRRPSSPQRQKYTPKEHICSTSDCNHWD